MRSGTFRRVAIGVGIVCGLVGAPAAAVGQFEAGIPVGSKAPVITVADLEGTPVDLGRFIGRGPVLIEFWASWCELCKALMPQLQAVKKAYGARVTLIGINITVNDSKERVRRYLARHQPPYLTLYDDKGVGSRAYDVPTTSFIVIVDAEGMVAYTGSGEDQDLLAAVGKVVGK